MTRTPTGLADVHQVAIADNGGAVVEIGIGIDHGSVFRVFALPAEGEAPARLAIDIQQRGDRQ